MINKFACSLCLLGSPTGLRLQTRVKTRRLLELLVGCPILLAAFSLMNRKFCRPDLLGQFAHLSGTSCLPFLLLSIVKGLNALKKLSISVWRSFFKKIKYSITNWHKEPRSFPLLQAVYAACVTWQTYPAYSPSGALMCLCPLYVSDGDTDGRVKVRVTKVKPGSAQQKELRVREMSRDNPQLRHVENVVKDLLEKEGLKAEGNAASQPGQQVVAILCCGYWCPHNKKQG